MLAELCQSCSCIAFEFLPVKWWWWWWWW